MQNKKKKAYGHTWGKLMIIYFIIGVTCFSGVYFLFFKQNLPFYASNYKNSTISTSPTVTADEENIKKQVHNFYSQWLNPPKIVSDQDTYKANYITNRNNAVKGYLTQKAVEQLNDKTVQYNAATCNVLSAPVVDEFSLPSLTGQTATMAVTISYSNPSTPNKIVTVYLLKSDSGWLIDRFTCPSE